MLALLGTAFTLSSVFGDSGIEEVTGTDGETQRVRTDGERCALPLHDGWTWRPASWTLVTPNGTMIGFYETLHGRPVYTEWEEELDQIVERHEGRDDAIIERDDTSLRVDFGAGGGLSVVQRFDRVGCHLTFSPPSSEVRAEEIDMWEELIASVERTYPQE